MFIIVRELDSHALRENLYRKGKLVGLYLYSLEVNHVYYNEYIACTLPCIYIIILSHHMHAITKKLPFCMSLATLPLANVMFNTLLMAQS